LKAFPALTMSGVLYTLFANFVKKNFPVSLERVLSLGVWLHIAAIWNLMVPASKSEKCSHAKFASHPIAHSIVIGYVSIVEGQQK
jgi:hypothetical protein